MGFRFPLASVLRWRESIEKREELALQNLQIEMTRVQLRIEEITAEIAKAGHEREEALKRWTHGFELKGLHDEMSAAVDARLRLTETLAALKKKKDVQMVVYRVARANRRMLTDLEKQHRLSWEQELERTDQKRLDDIFTSRLIRG